MRANRCFRAVAATAGLVLAVATAGCHGDPLHLMPEAASETAERVDGLTYLIFWLTTATLVGVQLCLLWFLFKYRRKPGVRSSHTHGNHTAEMIWTVAPAAILVFLAVYQMGLWNEVKSSKAPESAASKDARKVRVQVIARQFEWHFRYPGKDDVFGTADDKITIASMVVPKGAVVECDIRALDVIHSFYLPNFRLKQDAVPGLNSRMWFVPRGLSAERRPLRSISGDPQPADYWDIVCAELCGNGHTTMAARLYVVSDADYDAFLNGAVLTKLKAKYGGEDPNATIPVRAQDWDPSDTKGANAYWVQWAKQDKNVVTGKPAKPKRPFASGSGEDEE